MRDYTLMREVLCRIVERDRALGYRDFSDIEPVRDAMREVERLAGDGLVDADVAFDRNGLCVECNVGGLTSEGSEFFRLVENDGVWAVIDRTLTDAGIDVSYPLLKEVCEEIVKRYVTSFIPDI